MKGYGILIPTPIFYLAIQLYPIGVEFVLTLWLKTIIRHNRYCCVVLARQNFYLFCLQ